MHSTILEDNIDKISLFLQASGISCADDPVLVFGDDKAVEVLHSCSNEIISQVKDSPELDLCVLINNAREIFERINKKNKVLAIGFLASTYSAISKININRLDETLKIGVVIPVYNEVIRMMPRSLCESGQNALMARINQYLWLFSDRISSNQHLLFVDDLSTDNTKEKIKEGLDSIPEKYKKEISVLSLDELSNNEFKQYLIKYPSLKEYRQSIKGGSVYFGLLWMLEHHFDYVLFIDFDLTHLLEHAGLLLNIAQTQPNIGIVSNSRRTLTSKGYCDDEGNMITALFQTINNELLNTKLTDVNTGFKLMSMQLFRDIATNVSDLSLSLDAELIMLCLKNGYNMIENSGICFHQYVEGKQGVDRDYGMLLKTTMATRIKHNYNAYSPAPLYYSMERTGFYNLVKILKTIRTETQSNQEAIDLYRRRYNI